MIRIVFIDTGIRGKGTARVHHSPFSEIALASGRYLLSQRGLLRFVDRINSASGRAFKIDPPQAPRRRSVHAVRRDGRTFQPDLVRLSSAINGERAAPAIVFTWAAEPIHCAGP